MTTLDEIQQVVQNLNARIIILVGQIATHGTHLGEAATKYLELTTEMDRVKNNVDNNKKPSKEILESKAVQNLGTLSGPKEYRYWNQRLKNAIDQARPKHGRRLITYLETLTENMVNQQSELSQETDHTSWIKELIGEKEEDEKKTRTPETT